MEEIKKQLKELCSILDDSAVSLEDKRNLYHLIESIESETVDIIRKNHDMICRVQQLEMENEWFRTAFDSLPNPIFMKNRDAEFVYFNSRYEDYFHMNAGDFLHKTVLDLEYLAPEERKRYQEEDMRLIRTSQESHCICDFPDESNPTRKALYWSKGFVTKNTSQHGLIGEIVDISQREQLIEKAKKELQKLTDTNTKIQYLMKCDRLTELYNRRIIDDLISAQYKDGTWISLPISILLIDIDHFKQINDNFGHAQGDHILREFAKIMQKLCRNEDLLIRYGGEEFLIITHHKKSEGERMAEQIRAYTESHLTLPDQSHVTVSIGVTELLAEDSFLECVNRVDQAMYSAKNGGRNRVVVK